MKLHIILIRRARFTVSCNHLRFHVLSCRSSKDGKFLFKLLLISFLTVLGKDSLHLFTYVVEGNIVSHKIN